MSSSSFQVDHSRVNEFGYSGEMLEEVAKTKSKVEGGTPAAIESKDQPKAVKDKKTD
jgi:hypothetical protein